MKRMKLKKLTPEEIDEIRLRDASDPEQIGDPLPEEEVKALTENTRRKHPHLFK